MNVSKQAEQLKEKIINDINVSDLPIVLKRYIVSDILRELEAMHIKQLAQNEDGDSKNE